EPELVAGRSDRERGLHPRNLPRRGQVDGADDRGRVRGTHDLAVEHAGQADIRGVARLARRLGRAVETGNPRAEQREFPGGIPRRRISGGDLDLFLFEVTVETEAELLFAHVTPPRGHRPWRDRPGGPNGAAEKARGGSRTRCRSPAPPVGRV